MADQPDSVFKGCLDVPPHGAKEVIQHIGKGWPNNNPSGANQYGGGAGGGEGGPKLSLAGQTARSDGLKMAGSLGGGTMSTPNGETSTLHLQTPRHSVK